MEATNFEVKGQTIDIADKQIAGLKQSGNAEKVLAISSDGSSVYAKGLVEYTTAERTKLSGISTGANKVEDNHTTTNGTILVDGTSVVVYNDADIRQALAGFNKGYIISDESAITGTKNPTTGDWSNVTAITGITLSDLKIGDNVYLLDNTAPDFWVSQVSPSVSLNILDNKTDLANYYKKSEVDVLLNGKQNTLTAGTAISLANNTVSLSYSYNSSTKTLVFG